MTTTKLVTAAIPILLAPLLGACSEVDTPGAGATGSPAASGEPVVVDGPVEVLATTASDLLAVAADLHRLPDGRLLVSDELAHRIQVFAPDGSHLTTLGRMGQGPGELNRPGSLQSRGDTILVVDPMNGRVQFLSPEGEYLASVPIPAGYPPVLAADGRIIQPTLGLDSVLAVIRDLEGTELGRIGVPPGEVVRTISLSRAREEILEGGIPDLFRNTALPAPAPGDRVWLYFPALGRVEKWSGDGSRLVSVTLEEPGFPEEREWFVERHREAEANQLFPLGLIRSARVVGDHLWVLTGAGEEGPARIAVISPDGEVEGRLLFPGVRDARHFLPDLGAGEIFFTLPETAELVRVPLPFSGAFP